MMRTALALTLCLLAAAPLRAQDASGPPQAAPERQAAVGAAASGPRAARERRAERLDDLLGRLAAEDAPDARALQREIGALWAESGSAAMDLLLYRGREAIDERDLDKALDHLGALVELAPDFAEGFATRATAHFLQDEFWLAVTDLQRALALEPRHYGALAGLAAMLERTGDERGALAAMREAVRLNPHLEAGREMIERLAPKVDGRDI